MFTLRIEGISGAKILLKNNWPARTVSLISPDVRDLHHYGANHLIQRFEDAQVPMAGWVNPEPEHVEEVLEFTKNLRTGDRLLVHCHMGLRRSPAMALGILIQHGMTPNDAITHLTEVRPISKPNRLITQFVDEHFELGGELVQLVNKRLLET